MSDTTPQLFGWAAPENPGLLEEAFNIFGSSIKQMPIFVDKPKRSMLWELARQLLGNDIPNIPQQIGSCVAFGHGHGAELLQVYKLKNSDKNKWRKVHPSYIYGTSRVNIGGGRLGNSDGSIGIWAVQAMMKYGILFEDIPGVPKYTGALSKQWGRSGVPKEWIDEASKYLLKVTLDAAKVTTWEQLTSALANGYPVTVCSNQGFTMKPQSTGFHETEGQWPHCVKPDALIISDNSKKAKDIKVGDYVYTHRANKKKVLEIFKRNIKEKIVKIKAYGLPPIEVTKEHPVLVYRKDEQNNDQWKATWVLAKDLKLSDYVLSPIVKHDPVLELPKWSEQAKQAKNILIPITEPDPELAWLFGLYIADGNINKDHRITITLGKKEIETANRACKALQKIGMKPYIKYYDTFVRVIADSAALARSFREWFGGYSNEKRIPDFLYHGWDLDSVVNGILDGDGCIYKDRYIITSVSKNLIHQIRNILIARDIKCNLSTKDNSKGSFANAQLAYVLEWKEVRKGKTKSLVVDNHYLMPIKQIEEVEHEGEVYNFEVEDDHSYVADGITVHNCMLIVGYDETDPNPNNHSVSIMNSWGGVHGQIIDPTTNVNWPIGHIRARRKVVERMLLSDGGDSWSLSDMDLGFVPRLPESAFSIF